ncbi:helix-turn-helix transcriptional regulator [Pseudomonas sp. HR96]|uniref:AraC family transcriptional regulator n=1 Tax=Pseudomonas sp. HR96 TaxID=1027966 RepID=UPI002A75EB39|nr:helix-turn-helix transcriptional regulator [Pseudomonas sp. HR96]WPO98440.1 helix-turn-helix transcriptional regulator [Pseudomonas sp. HR96]
MSLISAYPMASAGRRQIIIRSDAMSGDAFGSLFERVFGTLYSDIPRQGHPLSVAGVYGRHDGVSFRHMSYRGDFRVQIPALDDEITFVLPTAGRIVFELANETLGVPSVGLAVEKREVRLVRFVDGHSQYGLSVRRGLFAQRLSLLLGRPVMQPVRFAPRVDLNDPAFDGLRAMVRFATGAELDHLINCSALLPTRLQEMLVDALLEVWPHNHSEALKRPAPGIAPRHVKLAMDYIQAQPEVLVSGSELAALSHVSLRALQDGFRRFAGTSIVGYQRQVRLECAYQALRQDSPRSVSEIAQGLGFANVGRFSQYFRSAYGVGPMEVRRR